MSAEVSLLSVPCHITAIIIHRANVSYLHRVPYCDGRVHSSGLDQSGLTFNLRYVGHRRILCFHLPLFACMTVVQDDNMWFQWIGMVGMVVLTGEFLVEFGLRMSGTDCYYCLLDKRGFLFFLEMII